MTIQPGMPRAQGSSSASADLRRRAEQEAVYADNAKFARLATLLRDLLAEQDRLLAALRKAEAESSRLLAALSGSAGDATKRKR